MHRSLPRIAIVLAMSLFTVLGTLASLSSLNPAQAQVSAQEDNMARVWVYHLAPFTDTLAGTAVTVRVDDTDVFTDFQYKETSNGYVLLPTGNTTIEILVGATVVTSATVNLMANTDYTVAATGNIIDQPVALLTTLVDDNVADAANAKVRVVHAVPAAAAATVDVRLVDDTPIITNFDYLDSQVLSLPPGNYDLKLTTPGGGMDLLVLDPITVTAGQIATVFAIGDVTNQPLEELVVAYNSADVWVYHFAPFADTVAGTSVDVRINGTTAITGFTFGETSGGYVPLTLGQNFVEVLAGGNVAISDTVTLMANTDYTLAAIGNGTNQDLALWATVDDNSMPAAGTSRVSIYHAAPFAPGMATVDVRQDNDTAVVENLDYREVVTATLPATATYDLKLTNPGGGAAALDIPPFQLEEGDIAKVFAIGDITNLPLDVWVSPFVEVFTGTSDVYVLHLAPFAETITGTEVTVRIDGTDTITGFTFSETSGGYVALPQGQTFVEIVAGSTTAISAELDLMADTDYTVAAIGDGTNQDLALWATVDDNSMPAAGTSRVSIYHAAPFASGAATVDVRQDNDTAVVENLDYREVVTATLPATATYDLKLTNPGGGAAALDIPPFQLEEGDIAKVFAIGDITNQPLDVWVSPFVEVFTGTSDVYVLHLAPFADTITGTEVTVRIDGTDTITGFTFSETSGGYVSFPQGQTFVEIVAGSTTAISGELMLMADADYTVAAIGDGANQDLELLATIDDNTTAITQTRVRVIHAAPFTSSLSATAVDVRTDAGGVVVDDLQYKQDPTAYLTLDAGTYDLQITSTDGNTTFLDIAPLTFSAEQVLSIFAIGNQVSVVTTTAVAQSDYRAFTVLPVENVGSTSNMPSTIDLPVILRDSAAGN